MRLEPVTAALGRGRTLAALAAQAALPAFGNATVVACQLALPPRGGDLIGHDGLLPANPETDGGRPADSGPVGRPGRGPSAVLLAVAEKAQGHRTPSLTAAAGLEAGADDDLRAVGTHRLDLLPRDDRVLRLARALCRERLGGAGTMSPSARARKRSTT